MLVSTDYCIGLAGNGTSQELVVSRVITNSLEQRRSLNQIRVESNHVENPLHVNARILLSKQVGDSVVLVEDFGTEPTVLCRLAKP